MSVVQHSKRKHYPFSPSASHRWLNCHGSVQLSKKAPPQKDSPYAAEGTLAHEILEYVVRRFSNLESAKASALKKFSQHPGALKHGWDIQAMVDHAGKSAETIFKLKPSKNAKLLIETKVHPAASDPGTLDYAWVDLWGWLIVVDFKYGAGVPVLPKDEDTGEENPQLMTYASGIAKKHDYDFAGIKLAIIQPRVWREDEDPLTICETTIKRLREFEKKAKHAVTEGKKPNAPLTPSPPEHGENWCRWCPAASFCPAISKLQMSKVDIAFDVATGLDENTIPVVEALTPETIPKVLDACDKLDVWIEKVRAYAFQLASDGHKIEGRKLVEKRSVRYWLDKAEEAAKKLYGSKAFSKPELLSPAQLEKAIGKEAKSFTAEFTDNKSSGYSLVPMKDRRQEVSSIVAFVVDEKESSE